MNSVDGPHLPQESVLPVALELCSVQVGQRPQRVAGALHQQILQCTWHLAHLENLQFCRSVHTCQLEDCQGHILPGKRQFIKQSPPQ